MAVSEQFGYIVPSKIYTAVNILILVKRVKKIICFRNTIMREVTELRYKTKKSTGENTHLTTTESN